MDRTQQEGTGSYVASGYLAPNLGRSNLKVLTEARACNVILKNKTAIGAMFTHVGGTHKVHAMREIVVSAGCRQFSSFLVSGPLMSSKRLESNASSQVLEWAPTFKIT